MKASKKIFCRKYCFISRIVKHCTLRGKARRSGQPGWRAVLDRREVRKISAQDARERNNTAVPAGWQEPEEGRSDCAVVRQPQQVRPVFGWHMNGMRPGIWGMPGCFARRQGGQVCQQTGKKLSCARALCGPALVRGVCRPVRGFLLLFWFTAGQYEATLQQQCSQLGNGQAHNRAPRTFYPVYQKSSLPLNGVGAGLVARFVCRHIGP